MNIFVTELLVLTEIATVNLYNVQVCMLVTKKKKKLYAIF